MNVHVVETIAGSPGVMPVQLLSLASRQTPRHAGSVSSFGLNGTIAHGVMSRSWRDVKVADLTARFASTAPEFHRRRFAWSQGARRRARPTASSPTFAASKMYCISWRDIDPAVAQSSSITAGTPYAAPGWPRRPCLEACDATDEPCAEPGSLAKRMCAKLSASSECTPLDALVDAWHEEEESRGLTESTGAPPRAVERRVEPSIVDPAHPSLLLLRKAENSKIEQAPLVIAHGLLGDHRGFGNLWGTALAHSDVYALRHRGLDGSAAFPLDEHGSAAMVGEYATALLACFGEKPFDVIGASFGAALAFHVARAAGELGARPRRIVLVDPPPAVPRDLPVPQMLSELRLAAMGVLLIHLRIEMGADVWTRFPQLTTLPEEALGCFVAAQCLPRGASHAEVLELASTFERMLPVYRQCRHALHTLSVNIEPFSGIESGHERAILMALSLSLIHI